MIGSVRTSSQFITKNAKHVKINHTKVKELSEMLSLIFLKNKYNAKVWKSHELHPTDMTESTLNWIFIADTLNFSFWGEKNQKHGVIYKGKTYTGYWSLHAVIRRAIDAGRPILDAKYYSSVSKEEFANLFRSDTETPFPLVDERFSVLQEAGKVLLAKYNGSFLNCVKKCDNSAEKLLELIVTDFPSYRDESDFEGQRVYFYKRAQILIGDIWSCFEGKDIGFFHDIDFLTIFADYRLPQVLVYYGVLEYSDELNQKLKSGELLTNGERLEVEIRGCTIEVSEQITEKVKAGVQAAGNGEGIIVNSCLLDYYLWDYRQDHQDEVDHIPFHKVRCIYY